MSDAGRAPRRNRIDPWGDLHAVAARGLFTGNRGCLVDGDGEVVRHHRGSLWIVCALEYKGWRNPLAAPGRWTPLFFLDDAVALAAGHRPCGLCRREDYESYRRAAAAGGATELNGALAAERLGPGGRGLSRAAQRRRVARPWVDLPDGTVVLDEPQGDRSAVSLVQGDSLRPFRFEGWGPPRPRPHAGTADVLTPPTSLRALAGGFRPRLHPSVNG